jgi:hypothetical protein
VSINEPAFRECVHVLAIETSVRFVSTRNTLISVARNGMSNVRVADRNATAQQANFTAQLRNKTACYNALLNSVEVRPF